MIPYNVFRMSDEAIFQSTLPAVRRILERLFNTDSELDAFLIDHFLEIHKQCSLGMQRTAKLNILLSREDPEKIFNAIQVYDSKGRVKACMEEIYREIEGNKSRNPSYSDMQNLFIERAIKANNKELQDRSKALNPPVAALAELGIRILEHDKPPREMDALFPLILKAKDKNETEIFRVRSGKYVAIVTMDCIDHCDACLSEIVKPGYSVLITNDSTGNLLMTSSSGDVIIGSGAVRYNQGTLLGEMIFNDGELTWTSSRITKLSVVADDRIYAQVREFRRNRIANKNQKKLSDCHLGWSMLITAII